MREVWCHLFPFAYYVFAVLIGVGVVALGVGGAVTSTFHRRLKKKLPMLGPEHPEDPTDDDEKKKAVPPEVTGLVERLAVSVLAVRSPELAVAAIGGWLTLKMAANWQRDFPQDDRAEWVARKRHGFLALLVGVVSTGIAWLGGLLVRFISGYGPPL